MFREMQGLPEPLCEHTQADAPVAEGELLEEFELAG